MYDSTLYSCRRGGLAVSAISGVDVALMDIVGKAQKVPVHKLLGGCYRDKVRVYASDYFNMENPSITIARAKRYVDQGFTAMKFGYGGFGRNLEKDVEVIEGIREAIGEDIDLMVDGALIYWRSVSHAIKMIRKFEKYNIYFIEEPLPVENIRGYAKLREAVNTRIAAGEHERTRYGFKDLMAREAVDVAQPDIAWVGGLSEAKKIADMAHLWDVLLVPHEWSTAINVVSGLHLVASMPNGFLCEFPIGPRNPKAPLSAPPSPLITELLADPLEVKNGYIEVPKKPGLGIELNQETVKKYTYERDLGIVRYSFPEPRDIGY